MTDDELANREKWLRMVWATTYGSYIQGHGIGRSAFAAERANHAVEYALKEFPKIPDNVKKLMGLID